MRNEARDGGPGRVLSSPETECRSVTDLVEDRESSGSECTSTEPDSESKPNLSDTIPDTSQDTPQDTADTEAIHMSDSKPNEERTAGGVEGRALRQNTRANIRPGHHSRTQSRCPPRLDEYGFLCDDDDLEYPKCHKYFKGCEVDELVEKKWITLLEDDQWTKHQTSAAKIQSYIQKGVPHCYRGRLWVKLLDVEMLAMKANFSYKANVVSMREQLVELGISEFQFAESLNVLGNLRDDLPLEGQENNSTSHFIDPVTLRQIFCDIERTYPSHKMFSSRCQGGQEGCAALFRVLSVYARYNREVGYCQGMSYIAGMLLMQMSEAEAFWCLVALLERPKYLQGIFGHSLKKMKNYAAVFKKLLACRLPVLTKHLRSLELQPLMFLTPWFMCVFAELPCWDTVLFIWDLFLLDGLSTIFQVALAIMQVCETRIMECGDLSSLLPVLLHVSPDMCQYENLVPVLLEIHIEPWEIKSLLAVISEEEDIRQKRKRILSGETENSLDGDAKRPKMQTSGESSSSPSIFRRFINFVTGKTEPSQKPAKRTHTQRLLQRAHSERVTRRRHAQLAATGPSSEEFGGTPGTPADGNAHHNRAREEFTFRMFNTPAPVRRSQGRQLALSHSSVHSPEIELEPMTFSSQDYDH
ncbi:TBC1 domain family member whacked-like [Liolophura sinensis]|uniref:TBC1 domain family member whacked-like n=1 Tax=Liolophura sinensis TaxID=3198878 RepID=UPI003158B65E